MRIFLITFFLVLLGGLGLAWTWTHQNYLSFMNKDYPAYLSKKILMEQYDKPGLVIFGDSIMRGAVINPMLNSRVVNFAVGATGPIENYFMIKRLLGRSVHPTAVLLSFNPYHLDKVEAFWDNAGKMGILDCGEINEIVDDANKQHLKFLGAPGFWNLETRLSGLLYSIGFPVYYTSSLLVAHWNERLEENQQIMNEIIAIHGMWPGRLRGSKKLNATAELDHYSIDPLIDLYFRKTIKLLEDNHIPVYYIPCPLNEVSIPSMKKNGALKTCSDYFSLIAAEDPAFHLLTDLQTEYSWEFFTDNSHFNAPGAKKFTLLLIDLLNRNNVPGGPYGAAKN